MFSLASDTPLIRCGIRAKKNRRDMPGEVGGRRKKGKNRSSLVSILPLTKGGWQEGHRRNEEERVRRIILPDYPLMLNYRPLFCVLGASIRSSRPPPALPRPPLDRFDLSLMARIARRYTIRGVETTRFVTDARRRRPRRCYPEDVGASRRGIFSRTRAANSESFAVTLKQYRGCTRTGARN